MAQEKIFENKIKKFLDNLDNCWYFKYWGGGMSKAGIPDIIASVGGYFVGIEVKASNGRPSPLQLRNVKLINDNKGFAVIVYPHQFDDLKLMLKYLSEGNTGFPRQIILEKF